jgi:hypothetical protein
MTTKELHSRTTGFGMAMGLPIADAIDYVIASARELDAAAEKTSHAQDFGSQIAQAVRRKSPRHAAATADNDDDEKDGDKDKDADSFAELLKKAVQRKSGQKQHKEQAERERSRYQQPQPRQRTKGE